MESMGKKSRRRRSFTPEFKAEIVELCQQGDRSAGSGPRQVRQAQDMETGGRAFVTVDVHYLCSGVRGPQRSWPLMPASRR
jgi:hypothetical protein